MKRPTISDIAQRAGVTKAAVSFALNGRPGVSSATRERILAIAAELGFQPSSAARALTAGQAGAFGLVLSGPARAAGREWAWLQLVAGVEAELARPAGQQATLLLALAEDAAAEAGQYRRWWAQRRVDGVLVVDPQAGDQRLPVLGELRVPAVVIGPPPGTLPLPSAGPDDRTAARLLARYLADQGHQRIAQVSGRAASLRSASRRDAFTAEAAAAGLRVQSVTVKPALPEPARAEPAAGPSGARETAGLLGAAEPPTAVVYDSDVLAAAGLGAAQRLGVSVPGAVSLVSWDDSPLCELAYPALTALSWDLAALGASAARLLHQLVAGTRLEDVPLQVPQLRVRASSGPAATAASSALPNDRSRRTA